MFSSCNFEFLRQFYILFTLQEVLFSHICIDVTRLATDVKDEVNFWFKIGQLHRPWSRFSDFIFYGKSTYRLNGAFDN